MCICAWFFVCWIVSGGDAESFLHRIPGLTPEFLYFNNDGSLFGFAPIHQFYYVSVFYVSVIHIYEKIAKSIDAMSVQYSSTNH